jgi:hypothetical protein
MLTRDQVRRKGDVVREADRLLLEALHDAGWRQADVNARDRVTAYLLDRGYDLAPDSIIEWERV